MKETQLTATGTKSLKTIQQERQKTATVTSSIVGPAVANLQRLQLSLKTRLEEVTKTLPQTKTAQGVKLNLQNSLRLRIRQVQQLQQQAIVRVQARPTTKGPLGLKIPPPFKPPKKPFAKPRRLIPKLKRDGYNTFIKSKGKFQKANLVPRTKSKAHDLGAWIADRTTSRQWLIKKTKKAAQTPKIATPRGYFGVTSKKYRPFKIKKGTKKPLQNRFIERRTFAIDSLGEKKQLSAAREIKRLRSRA